MDSMSIELAGKPEDKAVSPVPRTHTCLLGLTTLFLFIIMSCMVFTMLSFGYVTYFLKSSMPPDALSGAFSNLKSLATAADVATNLALLPASIPKHIAAMATVDYSELVALAASFTVPLATEFAGGVYDTGTEATTFMGVTNWLSAFNAWLGVPGVQEWTSLGPAPADPGHSLLEMLLVGDGKSGVVGWVQNQFNSTELHDLGALCKTAHDRLTNMPWSSVCRPPGPACRASRRARRCAPTAHNPPTNPSSSSSALLLARPHSRRPLRVHRQRCGDRARQGGEYHTLLQRGHRR